MTTKKKSFGLLSRGWLMKKLKQYFEEADNGVASNLISNESVAVLKEHNLRRHYDTKHLLKYPNSPTWYISCFFGFVFFFEL